MKRNMYYDMLLDELKLNIANKKIVEFFFFVILDGV